MNYGAIYTQQASQWLAAFQMLPQQSMMRVPIILPAQAHQALIASTPLDVQVLEECVIQAHELITAAEVDLDEDLIRHPVPNSDERWHLFHYVGTARSKFESNDGNAVIINFDRSDPIQVSRFEPFSAEASMRVIRNEDTRYSYGMSFNGGGVMSLRHYLGLDEHHTLDDIALALLANLLKMEVVTPVEIIELAAKGFMDIEIDIVNPMVRLTSAHPAHPSTITVNASLNVAECSEIVSVEILPPGREIPVSDATLALWDWTDLLIESGLQAALEERRMEDSLLHGRLQDRYQKLMAHDKDIVPGQGIIPSDEQLNAVEPLLFPTLLSLLT